MKTFTVFLAIILNVLPWLTIAQWQWQNPLPQGNTLHDIDFIDPCQGWAVGHFGTLLFTDDGGNNWEVIPLELDNELHSISFINNNLGWVAGNNGLILHTLDGGLTWEEQNSNTNQILYNIGFISPTIGWIVGDSGVILKTTDGGQNWEFQDSQTILSLRSICFSDSLNGWTVGGDPWWEVPLVLHTDDGGISWNELITPLLEGMLNAVYFTDSLNGWAGGGEHYLGGGTWVYSLNIILHTTDGGITWEWNGPINFGTIHSLTFKDSSNGWAVGGPGYFEEGNWGFVMYTSDGGDNWILPDNGPFNSSLNSITNTNGNSIFSVGRTGIMVKNENDTIFVEYSDSFTRKSIRNIYFIDSQIGWAATKNTVYKTEYSGLQWDSVSTIYAFGDIYDIYFRDLNHGWVIMGYYSNQFGANYYLGSIYSTENGGEIWTEQITNIEGKFFDICFSDQQTGWVVGGKDVGDDNSGIIYQTTDSGLSWVINYSGTSNCFYSVSFPDDDNGWISGANGCILHTADGGENWEEQQSGISSIIRDIIFITPEKGWYLGNGIYKTTNGGIEWTQCSSIGGWQLQFIDTLNGWTVAGDKLIYTHDGGESWITEELPTYGFNKVWFANPDTGWIAGEDGRVMCNFNGLTTNVLDNTVDDNKFRLNIYPNPSNEDITIEFEMSFKCLVEISMYDLSGKFRETILSEILTSGKHEIELQLGGLPTGVYFCRLQTSEGMKTKKIIKL